MNIYIVIFIVNIISIILYLKKYISGKLIQEHKDTFISVNNFYDKLFQETNNYLSDKKCKNLTKFFLNHKLLDKNKLSPTFSNSRGIVIKFKDNINLYKSFKQNNLECVYEIFKKNKLKKSNGYIFNILIIPTTKTLENKLDEIDYHYDNTLNIIKNNKALMPLQIDIIYIHLPNKFKNGELVVNYFANKSIGKIIKPEIGKMIKLRGDALHKVHKIFSKKDDYRISLVLEQYNVSNIDLLNIPNFTIL